MQAKAIRKPIGGRLLAIMLSVALVFTMMPLIAGSAYAEGETTGMPAPTDEQVVLTVTDQDNSVTEITLGEIKTIESSTNGEGMTWNSKKLSGVKLKKLFKEKGLDKDVNAVVTVRTHDNYTGTINANGKTVQALTDEANNYILAYAVDDVQFDPSIKKTKIKNGEEVDASDQWYVCLYGPNNTNDKWVDRMTLAAGNGDQPQVIDVPDMTITGDALVGEKTFTIKDIKKNIEINRLTNVSVFSLNNYGTEETYIFDGVYLIDLINYVGLKDGMEIEKVEAYPYNSDGTVNEKKIQTYTADEITKANSSGIKAMFAWGELNGEQQAAGVTDKTKVQRTIIPQFASEVNKSKWGSDIKKIVVTGKKKEAEPTPAPAPAVKDGQKATVGGSAYTVTSAAAGTAAFTKAKNAKKVTVPSTVKVNGKTLKVTQVNANAFKGKKIRTVTIGANVKTIKAKAFKGSKAKTIIVKTKALTKKSVKGSLKGSKVKTVKVKVGSKKVNKKYVKKYKKIFTKKNAGKKVKVKR